MVSDRTPVIIGVGQAVERLGDPCYEGLSPAGLAAAAARAAIADAGSPNAIETRIDIVGGIRTFEDSTSAPAAFGKPDKYPLAVARRLGLKPHIAILEKAGGQSTLALLSDLADRIARGEAEVALAFGSEAISTVRHLQASGEKRDWSEQLDGVMEDHGRGLEGLVSRHNMDHGLRTAPPAYGMLENARRARLGMSIADYRKEMGRLFAPFTKIAATNPYSTAQIQPSSADELVTLSERNRMVADPYTIKLVSRDQVNQGAAIILTSVGAARSLGIPEERWAFIHGCALAEERDILERDDIGGSAAARMTLDTALAISGKNVADISFFDFYSCFPIAVFAAAVDGLGLALDDPRGLTVTGGLPYFGGPGNNYSMHAFATMTERLRAHPGRYGLVGVNGGYLTKYGAVVLSTDAAEWKPCVQHTIQHELDERPRPKVTKMANGEGKILTYTIRYEKGVPAQAIVIGELHSGERFLANNADAATLEAMLDGDPLGRAIVAAHRAEGNRFAFDKATLASAFPVEKPAFRAKYNTALVDRRGHVLEVTINRPDQRNSISQEAHDDLTSIFDAYEADPDLWVAIITGAGDKAFCAGADLKGAAGGRIVTPLSGFAGITSRRWTKPLIAAVNGAAFGGGLEIVLAAHVAVADPAARFALSEVKVGVVAGAGGTIRLQRQIPRKMAMELLLTGAAMDVEEAHRLGLINRVSAPGDVLGEARKLADAMASVSPTSVRVTMQLVQEGDRYADADSAAAELAHSAALDALLISEDMAEGLKAFAEKRPPQWKNR